MVLFQFFEIIEGPEQTASNMLDLMVLLYCKACEEIAPNAEQFAVMCGGWQSEMLQEAYFEVYCSNHHREIFSIGEYTVRVL